MPIECSLAWTTKNRMLCPCCLEELNCANIVFADSLAVCPLCALPGNRFVRAECLRLLRTVVASNQWASYRRLLLFTPSRHPNKPLQLVRRNESDAWLLNPIGEAEQPVADENPIAGGSPV